MSKEERIAYFQTDYANMAPATRARLEEDLMRHYFRPRYQCVPFDPTELVELAKQQWPQHPQRAEALARCTEQWRESTGYGYFQDPKARDGKPCKGGFLLHCPRQGELLFDTDKDGGIIGVEYLAIVLRGEEEEVEPVPAMRIVHWIPGQARDDGRPRLGREPRMHTDEHR
jgi:hypothetical protein